ncbi:MAG: hypothetical protein ACQESF_07080 [Nanobdellota archaeon]
MKKTQLIEIENPRKNLKNSLKDALNKIENQNLIVKLVIFTNYPNYKIFKEFKNKIKDIIRNYLELDIPVSVLNNPPLGENGFLMEAWSSSVGKIEYKKSREIRYSLITFKGIKEIVTETICPKNLDNLKDACESVFKKTEVILKKERMTFRNVVRQWNYIQNITKTSEKKQNYQVFNQVRSNYYDKYDFKEGYPSATGIGTGYGLVNIEIIAISENAKQILPIENKRQTPAYKYSRDVLHTGNEPPRFSRGKLVCGQLFLSGTASITGQETRHCGLPKKQTEETLKNIKLLTSCASDVTKKIPKIEYLRIYVKNKESYEIVKKTLNEVFEIEKFIIVKADICRAGLLVEIEGFAS